ncbi:MAG: transaldolase family protein [Eubacteriales bacterium]
MEYFIDSANPGAIETICRYFPISGVTTNPSIISHERGDLRKILLAVRKTIGDSRLLHVQAVAGTAEGILAEARAVRALVGDPMAVKVPVSREGLRAMGLLKSEGFTVTATAIFSPQQAMLSAASGADYVAPYINRFDAVCGDGEKLVRSIANLFSESHAHCKILGASFKNILQVETVMEAGAQSITVAPELFDGMISHPMTDLALENFRRDWESVYGEKGITALLSE